MSYKKLSFFEVEEGLKMASHHLDCGYTVKVSFDEKEGVHDCTLYNDRGATVDSEEGLDEDGVEQFIIKSKELVQEYKDNMAAIAMGE